MIILSIISPEEFFELVEYTKIKRLCLNYGCTTCGNQDFIKLISKTIGIETVSKIVEVVTYDEIDKHNVNDWYMVMGLLLMRFGENISRDTPLGNRYYEHKRTKMTYRRETTDENQKIYDFEVKRASQKIEEKEQYLSNRQESSIIREKVLSEFNVFSLQEKLLKITNDYKKLPLYYPLDLNTITIEMLKSMPSSDLEVIQKRFSNLRKNDFLKFLSKVNEAIDGK